MAEANAGPARGFTQRFLRLVDPPDVLEQERGFGAAALWSLSAALAAGLALSLFAMVSLSKLFGFALSGALTFLWLTPAFALVTTPSFAACYLVYRELHRRGWLVTRLRAAAYCVAWHTVLHTMVFGFSEQGLLGWMVVAPVAVGWLWGSWLPAAVTIHDVE